MKITVENKFPLAAADKGVYERQKIYNDAFEIKYITLFFHISTKFVETFNIPQTLKSSPGKFEGSTYERNVERLV